MDLYYKKDVSSLVLMHPREETWELVIRHHDLGGTVDAESE